MKANVRHKNLNAKIYKLSICLLIINGCLNDASAKMEHSTAANAVHRRSITNTVSPLTYCEGGSVSVSYKISGTFNAGNVFTAQLSNAHGSFSSPKSIGSLTLTTAGTINATIPANTPAGKGYRIRVVSSNPSVTGSNNGSNITINSSVTATSSSNSPVCSGSILDLSSGGGTKYSWTGPNGFTSSQEDITISNASSANGGIYTVTVTNAGGCTATATTTVIINSPATPVVTSVNNCNGSSTLTASGYTGNLLWNTGATTASIIVTATSTYSVTQTVSGCKSASGTGHAMPGVSATPIVTPVNNCGSSTLTASGYTGSLLWNTGATTASITVTAAGTYSVIQTVSGCTSAAGTATASPQALPTAPVVTPINNCGSSTLTASGYTGSLLWNTGATTASITVTAAGTYSVIQTVSGCTSTAGTATASPQPLPAAPIVTPVNNCGTSTLTASGYTGSLLWNTGATTASITVTAAGTYSVTQTVSGCTSAAGTATASPQAPPAMPVVAPVNNCGNSTLTASGYTGNLLWSTGASATTITVMAAGTYSVTQTVSGCTSAAGTAIASPQALPATPIVTPVNNCGTSTLTASGYTGNLLWNTGATTASITVTAAATYSVTQTVSGCTSTAGTATASPQALPAAPVVTPVNNCGISTLTGSGYTGSLLWNTGATTASISVTAAATYSVTQTVNGCTSTAGTATASPQALPAAPVITPVNNCGTSTLTASGYTGSLLWNTGATTASITVTASGTYSVTQTVSGCTSAAGTATASPQALPAAPVVIPVNNCGSSILTASGYTGSLLWNTGATTASITVTASGTYSVIQTVSGCTSTAGTATASPQPLPAAPIVTPVNNCGTSTLTASGYTGNLLWNTGATTASITVTAAATYSVTQTVSGCTSTAGTATASPQALPAAPVVTPVNNCGISTLTGSGYTGSLLWNTGATTASISVTAAATYSVTQTVNGCTSTAGTATASPQALPAAPVITPVNNCGTSTLTASGYTGSLLWNTGATTASITVTAAATYSVTQTVSGCTSAAGTATASPQALPAAPVVTPVNNCGISTLTASGYTGSLLWNTGATTASITVTAAATYSVTQTVSGCTSAAGTATASPQALPGAPVVTPVNNCGSSTLTASGYTGSLLWNTGATTAFITVTTGGTYSVTQTISGCTSAAGTATASPQALPATPLINVINNCNGTSTLTTTATGNFVWSTGDDVDQSITVNIAGLYSLTVTGSNGCSSTGTGYATPLIAVAPVVTRVNNCNGSATLTASGYTGSLLWNTGATTASITVTVSGTYSVTQTVSGCTSTAGTGFAITEAPPTPIVSSVNNCNSSATLTASGYTGSLLWNTGATTASITVTAAGTYSVTQTVSGCTSAAGTATASPQAPPAMPVVAPVNNCGNSTLTASGYTGNLLWSTGASATTITVMAAGTYSVTQTVSGCTSAAGTAIASPQALPATPPVSVTNNCNGTSTLTTTATGNFVWSTGDDVDQSITVNIAGIYSLTVTGSNGCTSTGAGYASAVLSVAPVVTTVNNCNGTSTLTASGYTGSLLWSTGASADSVIVTSAGTYSVTQTIGGCTSAAGTTIASPHALPAIPVVTPVNNCGTSTLTASGYTGNLLWNTGATTASITATAVATYSVIQTIGGCTSAAGTATASPQALPATPPVSVTDNCNGTSTLTTTVTGNFVWSTGDTVDQSIMVTTAGTYSLTVTGSNGCTGIGTAYATAGPPPTPIVTPVNNCNGTSTLTASGYTGNLLWSTGATTVSITVTTAGTYSVTQTAGCTSAPGTAMASPAVGLPPAPVITVNNTYNCAAGQASLIATGYTGTLHWNSGSTASAIVTGAAATWNLYQTVGSCNSPTVTAVTAPVSTPAKPLVTVQNYCNVTSVLSTTSAGNLLWSNGATTSSITVTAAGTYNVTATAGGCPASQPGAGVATPFTTPSAPAVTDVDNCGYSILSTTATGTLLWSTGDTTSSIIVTSAGAYTVTTTNISGCTSTPGSGTAIPINLPQAPMPSVTDIDSCGNSVLTAGNYSGSLLWNTGATTSSITVTAGGVYSVAQTLSNGCVSIAGAAIASPILAPVVTVVNNNGCSGPSTLTASSYIGALTWNNGSTTSYIIVTEGGVYSVTQTANGCTSAPGIGVASITPPPPVIIENNSYSCATGRASLIATAYSGTLHWNNGSTASAIVTGASATWTLYQTIGTCNSPTVTAVTAPITTPATPVVTVVNTCGMSTLSTTATGNLLWTSVGATTSSITIAAAGSYSVTQTVGSCTSASGHSTATPLAVPSAPTVTDVDNCGSSTLSTIATGALLWSTGATTSSITVTSAGAYTVTTTNTSGCTSTPGSGTANPVNLPPAPEPSVTDIDNCGNSILTAGGYSGTLLWSTGATTSSITVITGGLYSVTQTLNDGCTSAPGTATASPILAPVITYANSNGCSGPATLTASSYIGVLTWNTEATTASITITAGGTYSVTQTANGCTSSPATVVASITPPTPVIIENNLYNCAAGLASLVATGYSGTLHWSNGSTASAIVTGAASTWTLYSTIGTCSSLTVTAVTAPLETPSKPGIISAPGSGPCASSTVTNPGTYYAYSVTAVTGATSYIWTVPSGFNYTSLTTTAPSLSVTTTNAVAGNITVQAGNGCGTSSASSLAITFSCRDSGTGTEVENINMIAYPNPAHDRLNIDFGSDNKDECVIKMIDITGRLLIDKVANAEVGDNHFEFDIGNFAKGIYILSFSSGEEKKQVRVVVE